MLKDIYVRLQKVHRLPLLDVLDREFQLSAVEEEDFPLRRILARMGETLQDASDVLHVILQPDTGSLMELCECRCFSETDKNEAFELFRRLMRLVRAITESNFLLTDENDASTVRLVAKDWPELRKAMFPLVAKMKECWHRPVSSRAVLEYMG